MKIEKYLMIIILILYASSCTTTTNIRNLKMVGLYKVTKIKSDKNVYIIEASRNDSIFKILSEKNLKREEECNKIKKNYHYNFTLKKLFPLDNSSGSLVSMVEKYEYNGTIVKIERKYHSSIYMAPNLKGLCIEGNYGKYKNYEYQ